MFLSDSLPSEIRFRQAYTLSFYLSVMGRVSPVPNHTFHTYRFLYTEGFFCAAFQFLRTFHGFRPYAQGSTPLCSLFRDLFLTIRQNSLNVTVCMIACTFYQGYFIHSLSTLYYYSAPSLATQLTGDYRDRTYTGKCGPASLDTRRKKGSAKQILSLIFSIQRIFAIRFPTAANTHSCLRSHQFSPSSHRAGNDPHRRSDNSEYHPCRKCS